MLCKNDGEYYKQYSKTNFKTLPTEEKLKIKKIGRPTPVLNLTQQMKY